MMKEDAHFRKSVHTFRNQTNDLTWANFEEFFFKLLFERNQAYVELIIERWFRKFEQDFCHCVGMLQYFAS